MRTNDDRDIKLFVSNKKEKETSDSDILAVAEALDVERSNGNLMKARVLGEKLAAVAPEKVKELLGIELDTQKTPSNILYQTRVLMLFTAQVTLHSILPQILSTQAVNSMYDYLRDNFEGFYDNVIECTSFSLYYLAIRNKVSIEDDISSSFAMLCGNENDEKIKALGSSVFVEMGKYVKNLVKDFEFEA